MGLVPPRPPFLGWPVQRSDDVLGYAWFCAPNVIVTQVLVDSPGIEATGRLHDWVDECLAVERDAIGAAAGLIAIHDLRAVTRYERGSRELTRERMSKREAGYLSAVYVALSADRPLVRMGVQGIALFSTMVLGRRLEVIDSPSVALAKHGVRAPARGAQFPSR